MPYRFTPTDAYQYQDGALFLGQDDHGRKIGIKTERHAIALAGSRTGKGAALLIPNARRWPGSLLVIDPKGENLEQSWKARQALGQTVHAVMPFGGADVPDLVPASFNPLSEIDLADPNSRTDLKVIADGLVVVHDPKHMEWIEGARSILAGVLAYVVETEPTERRTFGTMREILTQPNQLTDFDDTPILDANGNTQGLYADAQRMSESLAGSGLARAAGVSIMTAITSDKGMDKEFLGGARRSTEWLDDEQIGAVLNTSTFSLSALKKGTGSVFLVLPPDYIKTHSPFLRLFVQCALRAMAKGGQKDHAECLFLLDEFYALGRIDQIKMAAGLMPSYGVHLFPFLQTFGQLVELYGKDGASAFFTNSDAAIFFGNSGDQDALEYQSNRIGPLTPHEVTDNPPLPPPVQTPAPPTPLAFQPLPQPRPRPFQPLPQPQPIPFEGEPPPANMPWYEGLHLAKGWFFAQESVEQSQKRLSVDQENQFRAWQHRKGEAEAAHRANEDARMREWQGKNAEAEAAHRANEDARMREWQGRNAKAEAAHRANEEGRMREWQQDVNDARAWQESRETSRQRLHDFGMQEVRSPRLSPSQIDQGTGKRVGIDQVAQSMIVFAPAGDVLRLKLAPHFDERPPVELPPATLMLPPPAAPAPAKQQRKPRAPFVPRTDAGELVATLSGFGGLKGAIYRPAADALRFYAPRSDDWQHAFETPDALRAYMAALDAAADQEGRRVLAALVRPWRWGTDLAADTPALNAVKNARKVLKLWENPTSKIRFVVAPGEGQTLFTAITTGFSIK